MPWQAKKDFRECNSPARDAQRDVASEQYSAKRLHKQSKNAAFPKAIAELKAAGTLPESVELRQIKYLNNLIEQDHRFIKRLVKPGMGFFSRQRRIIASRAGGIVGLNWAGGIGAS